MQYAGLEQMVVSRKKIDKLQQTVEKLDDEYGIFALIEELKTKNSPTLKTRSVSRPTYPPPPPPIGSFDNAISFEGQPLSAEDNSEKSPIPQTRSGKPPTSLPLPPLPPIESSDKATNFERQPLFAKKLEEDLLQQIKAGITLRYVKDRNLDEPEQNQINDSSLESVLQLAIDRIREALVSSEESDDDWNEDSDWDEKSYTQGREKLKNFEND